MGLQIPEASALAPVSILEPNHTRPLQWGDQSLSCPTHSMVISMYLET